MRILIVPSWYPSEAEPIKGIFFKELAEALASAGIEVGVLYINVARSVKKEGMQYNIVNGVHEYRYNKKNRTPGIKAGMRLQRRSAEQKAYEEVRKGFGKPDVIHLESCDMIDAAEICADGFGCPIIYTEHLSNVLTSNPGSELHDKFEYTLSKSACAIAISEVFARKMREAGAEPVIIPNGIDTSNFSIAEPEALVIKALGSLRNIKRYDVLIEAFALVAAKINARLVIGGRGSEEAKLRAQAVNLGIEEKVTFAGEVAKSDVPDFYRDASIFVCSSDTETFSVVTAEALCSGVPIVATRCGGPEGMIDPSNGILVDTGDSQQMAAALVEIAESMDKYNRKEIAASARKKYDYASVVAAHMSVYGKYKEL